MRLTRGLAAAAVVVAAFIAVSGGVHAGSVQALPPVTNADGRLGLCDVLPGSASGSASWARLAHNAGARVNRWEFRWDRIEPRRGTWNFSQDDPAVAGSRSAGLAVEGILIGTPGWATAPGQRPGNGVPRGLYLPPSNRRNLWADYVRRTVQHYRGVVRWWEIWNEPDLGFFWMGRARDYFRLLAVSFTVIRQSDPAARVIMAGMVDSSLRFVASVLRTDRANHASAANSGYFDIAAWHAYGPAAALYTNLQRLRALLDADGFGRARIWVTEDGFPASNPNGEPRQAAYILQTVAFAFAAGAERVLIYRASDDAEPKSWGILTASGATRAGYVAFQEAAHYLTHVQAISYAPTAQIARFVFYQKNRRVTLLWSLDQTDRVVSLPTGQPNASVVDPAGGASGLATTNGMLSVPVPGAAFNRGVDAANSVVGGPPVLEIEENSTESGLASHIFMPSVAGYGRQVALFNPGDSAVAYQLRSSDDAMHRIAGVIDPHGVGLVDLDLLAGSAYQGSYDLDSGLPLAAQAVSNLAAVQGAKPSRNWYVASAPPALAFRNTARSASTVDVRAYANRGHVLAHVTLTIPAGQAMSWVAPQSITRASFALSAQATTGIIVTQPTGAAADAAPAARPQWYVLRPRGQGLVVFNPGSSQAAVTVTMSGPSPANADTVELGPRRSIPIATQNATAMTVMASSDVVVGSAQPAAGPISAPLPATQTSLALAGSTTRVDLFNPSSVPAHVAVSIAAGSGVADRAVVVQPSHIYAVKIRGVSDAPAGASITSDVPVVAGER
jgi:hypothetical protein